MNVYKDSGFRLPWRPWMNNPCHRCERELTLEEYRYVDWIAQVVMCERCAYHPFLDVLGFDGSDEPSD